MGNRIYNEARKHQSCQLIHPAITFEELLELHLTPQGIEFCMDYNFPSLKLLERYRSKLKPEHQVYIHQNVELTNPPKVTLAGNCNAILTYNDAGVKHDVMLLHGAKALIKVAGYAVVAVYNVSGTYATQLTENGLVL